MTTINCQLCGGEIFCHKHISEVACHTKKNMVNYLGLVVQTLKSKTKIFSIAQLDRTTEFKHTKSRPTTSQGATMLGKKNHK
jgi:hypothetical protein